MFNLFRKKKKQDERPKLFDNLIFAFKDLDGKSYYRFPEDGASSIERIGAINQFIVYISRGLESTELYELLDIIDWHIENGIKTENRAAKISGVTHEIRLRERIINSTELYYNYLAAHYVREDEDPRIYNEQAQREKVEAFKKAAGHMDSFFFALPELKGLWQLLGNSIKNWNDVIKLSEAAQQRKDAAKTILK